MVEMHKLDDTGYLVMVRVYDENEFKAEWYATLPEAVARQSEVIDTTGEEPIITTPGNMLRKNGEAVVGMRGAKGTECPTGWDPSEDTNA